MGVSILQSEQFEQLTSRVPRMVEAVLVLLLLWVAVDLFWPAGNTAVVSEANGKSGASAVEEQGEVAIQPIINAKLFGEVAKTPVVKPKPAVVVKSARNIKLQGTILAGDRSAAMLQVRPGARMEMYKVGQAVLPGVILKEVEKSHVVLESSGKLEIVELEWKKVPGHR